MNETERSDPTLGSEGGSCFVQVYAVLKRGLVNESIDVASKSELAGTEAGGYLPSFHLCPT